MKYTQAHAQRNTDIHEHLPTLYALVVQSGAKDVLELGVRGGESTVPLLEGVHATGGKLVSVDYEPCLAARDMVKRYGLGSRWEFVNSEDLDFGAKLNGDRRWDLIFIDTSHIYAHTKKEIALFEPLVRPGGHLVFHDTSSFPEGVLKPINEFLRGRKGYTFVNHQNNNGLGIIRKPA